MKAGKTRGGLILPDNVSEPQSYGRVLTAGELILEGTPIKEGNTLIFHPRAGMDMLMEGRLLKVLKYDELYGILTSDEIKENLTPITVGGESKIVTV